MHEVNILLIVLSFITLPSLLLKFIKSKRENVSIFLDIKRRNVEIKNKIQAYIRHNKLEPEQISWFRFAISDWFSAIAIALTSYLLIYRYFIVDIFSLKEVYIIGFLFFLLTFNIIFLAVSIIERRIGFCVDEFTNTIEQILNIIQLDKVKWKFAKNKTSI